MMIQKFSNFKYVKISLPIIFFVYSFIIFFPPALFLKYTLLVQIRRILILINILIMSIQYIKMNKLYLKKFDKYIFLFLIYGFLLNLVSYSELLDIFIYLKDVVFDIVGIILIVKLLYIVGIDKILYKISTYYIFLVWINACLMLMYPSGIITSSIGASGARACWIFGSKNEITSQFVLIMMFLMLNYEKRKIISIATMLLMILEAGCTSHHSVEFMQGSTTAILVTIVMLVVFILKKYKIVTIFLRIVSVKKIVLISIFLTGCIWILSWGQVGWLNTILGYVGKNTSFSSRNILWNEVWSYIKMSPLFGYGIKKFYFRLINVYTSSTYSFWGSILLHYGIVGLIMLGLGMIQVDRLKSNKELYVIKCGMLSFFLIGLVNELNWTHVILIFELYLIYSFREEICG